MTSFLELRSDANARIRKQISEGVTCGKVSWSRSKTITAQIAGDTALGWAINGTNDLRTSWQATASWEVSSDNSRSFDVELEADGYFEWHDSLDWTSWYERAKYDGFDTVFGTVWSLIEGALDLFGDKLLDMEYDIIIVYTNERSASYSLAH